MATAVNPPRFNFYSTIKRSADVVSSACLLAAFSPLFLVVAAVIACESRGGVFFRQERVGRGGRTFRIIKFRTMVANAELIGPQITAADDERMTRLGRLLRATKIDELPQLWNVLVGDMSLVGPRPQVPRYVRHFPLDARDEILSVLPGITGPTALQFRHEESILDARQDKERFYIDVLLPIKCSLDQEYVRCCGVSTDAHAMLATLWLFLRGIGHRLLRRPIGQQIELSPQHQRMIEEYCPDHPQIAPLAEPRYKTEAVAVVSATKAEVFR
ncbi:MAG: sugar transferase [Fimbriimonadaceae bacterium]